MVLNKEVETNELTATLALTATPVNANELEYALAYREEVNSLTEYLEEDPALNKGNITRLEEFRLLRNVLRHQPEKEMSRVAAIKVALCNRTTTVNKLVETILETHRTSPKSVVSDLVKEAHIRRAVMIDMLPCAK